MPYINGTYYSDLKSDTAEAKRFNALPIGAAGNRYDTEEAAQASLAAKAKADKEAAAQRVPSGSALGDTAAPSLAGGTLLGTAVPAGGAATTQAQGQAQGAGALSGLEASLLADSQQGTGGLSAMPSLGGYRPTLGQRRYPQESLALASLGRLY